MKHFTCRKLLSNISVCLESIFKTGLRYRNLHFVATHVDETYSCRIRKFRSSIESSRLEVESTFFFFFFCAGNRLRTITSDRTAYNDSSLSSRTRRYDRNYWEVINLLLVLYLKLEKILQFSDKGKWLNSESPRKLKVSPVCKSDPRFSATFQKFYVKTRIDSALREFPTRRPSSCHLIPEEPNREFTGLMNRTRVSINIRRPARRLRHARSCIIQWNSFRG